MKILFAISFSLFLVSCSFNFEGVHNSIGDTHIKLSSEFLPFTKINKTESHSTKDTVENKKLSIFAVSNPSSDKAE